jgi:pimeloyl-ACP methyl ester carboxylesterase
VVAGADDRVMPVEGMRRMAGAIPDARFALIPGAGHLAPLEQPLAVNRALASFLDAVG